MNNFKKYTDIIISKKFVFGFLIIFFFVLVFVISKLLPTREPQSPLTVPLITQAITPPSIEEAPLNTENPHNPTQRLVFNWGSINPDLPNKITGYKVVTPLVNSSTINVSANKLGFKALDKSMETDDSSPLWVKNDSMLAGNLELNQILYNSTSPIPESTKTITKDQAISTAVKIISDLFGSSVQSNIETNPETKYLKINIETEDEPAEVAPEVANIINVNFYQTIDNLRLINLSKNGETISVAIDTTEKLFLLYVYGGYLNIDSVGEYNTLGYSRLKEVASGNAIRVSYSRNIDDEAAYTEARTVIVNVNKVSLGYFQRTDNTLFPVYIIEGQMSASNIEPFPATYIVPATGI